MAKLFIHAHVIVDGNREFLDGAVLIDGDKIVDVFPQSNRLENIDAQIIDLKGNIVMPGFFDSHTNGIEGIDFENCDITDYQKASYYYAKKGTTSFLITLPGSKLLNEQTRIDALNNIQDKYARFQGIHLEGPFLNDKYAGLRKKEELFEPDLELLNKYLNNLNNIKQMTLAPELKSNDEIARILHNKNIRVMAGHSGATKKNLNPYIDGVTHLFNGMKPLSHKEETLINWVLSDNPYFEIIADGNHVGKDVLKLIMNNADRNKMMLVSDSTYICGMKDGEYTFAGIKVYKNNNKCLTKEGNYAGSVSTINDEMKILYKLGAKYNDLLLWSGLNAYRFYGLDDLFGTIQKGKRADLVIMDEDLNVKDVIIRGEYCD